MGLNITKYPQRIVNNNPALISKWSAINHEMIFEMERKDYPVFIFYIGGVLTAVITVGTMIDNPLPGDKIYVESSTASGTFTLATFGFPNIFTMEPQSWTGGTGVSGFINMLSRKNYFIRTNIYGVDAGNNYVLIGQSKNKPDSSGRGSVDVSSFLKNIVGYQDNFSYIPLNEKDETLGSPYNITYSENWQFFEGPFSGISNTLLRWGVNSAKQIQDLYGANMGEYVPFFIDAITPVPFAKFLSDFEAPTYFPGFPFSLSFIYSEYLVGIETYRHQENFDINGNVIIVTTPLKLNNGQAQEVNRLLIDYGMPTTHICGDVWLESDGTIDCVQYLQPGYVAIGYVQAICGLPIISLPPELGNPTS